MAHVGKNIRNMRTKNKMTQDELAEKLFVSRQTVSNYETGKSNPDIDMLVKIAEVLNTDVNVLIFGIPTPPDKKREYVKFIIGLSIVLILLIFMSVARPWLKIYSSDTFNTGLNLAFQLCVYPLLLFLTGWCSMQASGIFLGAKPLAGRIPCIIHYFMILFLILYGITVISFGIGEISYAIKLASFVKANAGSEYQISREGGFLNLASNLYIALYYFRSKYQLVYAFFFSGAVLWGTTPIKPDNKTALPPSPDTLQ